MNLITLFSELLKAGYIIKFEPHAFKLRIDLKLIHKAKQLHFAQIIDIESTEKEVVKTMAFMRKQIEHAKDNLVDNDGAQFHS